MDMDWTCSPLLDIISITDEITVCQAFLVKLSSFHIELRQSLCHDQIEESLLWDHIRVFKEVDGYSVKLIYIQVKVAMISDLDFIV